ncbi:hypothetical protein EON65_18010 [archaeon]|nr:MAG: hypothetical protein EON65_18010 [archaeon]
MSGASFLDKPPIHEIYDPNRFIHETTHSADHSVLSPLRTPRHRSSLSPGPDSPDDLAAVEQSKQAVFPGCCGPLHHMVRREVSLDSALCDLFGELPVEDLIKMSYMFNFRDSSNVLTVNRKVKMQLDDTDWSRPFSLDSVGVNQVVSIEHPTRGLLEVGVRVSVAPGRLSKYTKIVRLQPRLAVVNRLKLPLRVIQASGFAGETTETEITANHIRAYHLPVLFGERAVAFSIDGPWQQTVFFNLDQIGAFILEARRSLDLATIPHVNTRGAPEYVVFLPSSKIIGITFETDWGEENIVVKAIQGGSFAARETDIRVGDVLLAVDDESVSGSKFELAMIMLKSKVATDGCAIKLRTVEEKMRLIRESALHNSLATSGDRRRSQTLATSTPLSRHNRDNVTDVNATPSVGYATEEVDVFPIRVELRLIASTVMVQVSELSSEYKAEYRIENRTVCYRIHYKQKGIAGSVWYTLNPGQSRPYIWQDPFKPHKLVVHVGDNILCPCDSRNRTTLVEGGDLGERGRGDETLGKYLSYMAGVNNDNSSVICLDEIGSKEFLALSSKHEGNRLLATIKSEGPTKVLVIVPSLERIGLLKELRYVSDFLKSQVEEYLKFVQRMTELSESAPRDGSSRLRIGSPLLLVDTLMHSLLYGIIDKQRMAVDKLVQHSSVRFADDRDDSSPQKKVSGSLVSFKPFERLFDAGIEHPHQLLVEVIEARELSPLVRGKTEDVYCKLYIRNEEHSVIE